MRKIADIIHNHATGKRAEIYWRNVPDCPFGVRIVDERGVGSVEVMLLFFKDYESAEKSAQLLVDN
jgi:hypothetical protein